MGKSVCCCRRQKNEEEKYEADGGKWLSGKRTPNSPSPRQGLNSTTSMNKRNDK